MSASAASTTQLQENSHAALRPDLLRRRPHRCRARLRWHRRRRRRYREDPLLRVPDPLRGFAGHGSSPAGLTAIASRPQRTAPFSRRKTMKTQLATAVAFALAIGTSSAAFAADKTMD